jgi:hypothetical protein
MSIDRARPTGRKHPGARWAVPAILLALALATPLQALAADPPRSDPVDSFEGRSRVAESINLYRSGTMVLQYTNYWCVPAATQGMVNIVRGTTNRSYSTQQYMYTKTRQHNQYSYATRGNDPVGWAWAATYFSRGEASYAARAYTSRSAAIREIADSLARTRHPVGVTVRKGTHAWVVLGFKGDVLPGDPSSRRVFGFYVSGPLGSPTDPWVVKYLTIDAFNKAYTPYHEWQRTVPWEGKYVVISD